MARARLHIICGNCGCNDQLTFQVVLEGNDISDDEPKFTPAVRIRCGNCSTLHDLAGCIPEELKPVPLLAGRHIPTN